MNQGSTQKQLGVEVSVLHNMFVVLSIIMAIFGVMFVCNYDVVPAVVCFIASAAYLGGLIPIAKNRVNIALLQVHFTGIVYTCITCFYYGFDYGFQFYSLHTIAFCYIGNFSHRWQSLSICAVGLINYAVIYFLAYGGYCREYRIVFFETDMAFVLYMFHVVSILLMFLRVIVAMRSNLYTSVIDKTLDNLIITSDGKSDILSGLLPRQAFNEQIEALEGVKSANLALIDLDHFKQINDFYGYEQGDHIIFTASALLKEIFSPAYICRWGGEEFLVFCDNSNPDEFFAACQKFSQRFSEVKFHPGEYSCSCSIGCLCVHSEYRFYAFDEYLNKLEKNLQDAKSIGRSKIVTTNL